jgi:long-chain acyl-CoA synthetase
MNYFDNLDRFGEAPALVCEDGTTFSYNDVQSLSDRLGSHLPERGLAFILADNRPEAVVGYIGCLRSRVPAALFSADLHPSFLSALLAAYKPPCIWLPQQRAAEIPDAKELHRFGNYVLLNTGYAPQPVFEALALLVTTSGSTGSPKLVRLSYDNLVANTTSIAAYLHIETHDRALTSLPMHYVYGLSVLNSHLHAGAAVVLTKASLAEKRFWLLMEKYRITSISGVPYTFEMLRKLHWQQMNVPGLKTLTQAGGKLRPDLVREFAAASQQAGIRFYVMYGAAEATARMSYLPPELALEHPGSIGIPIPGGEFWIEDENGQTIRQPGITGELCYRGPNVSLGYASCSGDLARGDERGGILHTGDLAQRDELGLYSIVGRRNRFLKLFGNRVNLEELEQIVRGAGIDCACGGDDQALRIYITDASSRKEALTVVQQMTRLHPAALRIIELEKIPRNPFGKIAYGDLP